MSGDFSTSRRTFLGALGGLGLSSSLVGDVAPSDNREISYVAGWNNEINDNGEVTRKPFYKTMPMWEWNQMQATNDAIEEVGEYLGEFFDSPDDHLGILESADDNSPTGRRLDVAVEDGSPYSEEQVRSMVPRQVLGQADIGEDVFDIPVGIATLELGKDSHECYVTDYPAYADIVGAAPIGVDDGSIGCTAGPYVHGTEGEGWITASHVIDGSSDGDVWHLKDAHSVESVIGAVADTAYGSNGWVDTGFFKRTGDRWPYEWIANHDYTDNEGRPMTRVVADAELKRNEDDTSWTVDVQGQITCRSSSYVRHVQHNSNGEPVAVLLGDEYTEDGDSGGPYFHPENGEAAICANHVGPASINGDIVSYGTTAETVEDKFGGGWMTQ